VLNIIFIVNYQPLQGNDLTSTIQPPNTALHPSRRWASTYLSHFRDPSSKGRLKHVYWLQKAAQREQRLIKQQQQLEQQYATISPAASQQLNSTQSSAAGKSTGGFRYKPSLSLSYNQPLHLNNTGYNNYSARPAYSTTLIAANTESNPPTLSALHALSNPTNYIVPVNSTKRPQQQSQSLNSKTLKNIAPYQAPVTHAATLSNSLTNRQLPVVADF
jgi:hypothetical protein